MSLVDDFQDLNLEDFFCERSYPSMPEVISSSKGKKAIMFMGFYYNHLRENKASSV